MRKTQIILTTIILSAALLPAQDLSRSLEFHFEDRAIVVPKFGVNIEALPVLELVGAQATYSPAAGTWGVLYGERVVQFAIDHKVLLVNGELQEARETPIASPGGVAVSLKYLERWLLSPIGFHLEPFPRGYRIVRGARFSDPVSVRPVAADFGSTTTLVLSLSRETEVDVEETEPGTLAINFEDAIPQLDSSVPFRSRRVRSLTTGDKSIFVELASGFGLVSWHPIESPPRVTIELGPQRQTPTPAPARGPITSQLGPRPVVIDPGHGGDDIGASSPDGLMEKEVVLSVARRLARRAPSGPHTRKPGSRGQADPGR
jgi:N-acetylmuramoyl-L-alanine amidase